jgi:hypothetical protein
VVDLSRWPSIRKNSGAALAVDNRKYSSSEVWPHWLAVRNPARITRSHRISDCCFMVVRSLARCGCCLFVVVENNVRRRRLHAELAEHADDLAAMQRPVVHDVHHDLPGGEAGVADEPRFERHLAGHVVVGGRIGPGFPLGLQARPFFNDEIERRQRVVRGQGIAGVGDKYA